MFVITKKNIAFWRNNEGFSPNFWVVDLNNKRKQRTKFWRIYLSWIYIFLLYSSDLAPFLPSIFQIRNGYFFVEMNIICFFLVFTLDPLLKFFFCIFPHSGPFRRPTAKPIKWRVFVCVSFLFVFHNEHWTFPRHECRWTYHPEPFQAFFPWQYIEHFCTVCRFLCVTFMHQWFEFMWIWSQTQFLRLFAEIPSHKSHLRAIKL